MCGICGIINFDQKPVQNQSLVQMMSRMKHRGPDDNGTFIEDNVGLGFVRLSIIDLTSAGHQPMFDITSRYVIIFNGEIYNYIELREELKKKGVTFRTNTDTEVLLYSYITWGPACLDKFNGMWAFAIYDKAEQSVFMARDRFGVKPLYYFADDKQLVFASDIPPILEVLDKKPEPDDHSVYDYLLYNRTDQNEHTFFKGLKKLQHGHTMSLKNGLFKIEKWYRLEESIREPFVSYGEYRELFSDSIGLRLRSDVPVGVCLSGGLDSSSIVSVLLKDHHKKDINTFSAVFGRNVPEDESEYIDEFSGQLKSMFYTSPTADSFYNDLADFMKAHSEPLPTTSPYAQYKVMELASKHVTVLLDGQGADEQLAGYHYFFGFYYKELLRKMRLILLSQEIMHYGRKHHSWYALQSLAYFMMPRSNKEFLSERSRKYIRTDFLRTHSGKNEIIDFLYDSKNLKTALINHFEYKLEHLLKWEDRNSMWFSIEARVPFLDYRLVEKTLALPSKSLISKGNTKHYLREAMKGYLPEKIRTRNSKFGFFTPDNDWFRNKRFRNMIEELLISEEFRQNPYIDSKVALTMYANHLKGNINISREIWKWINLSHWLNSF
jgi:asparagine synthase (glutamine-hydrolysing)